jgi:hypothetical protein
MDPFRGRSWPIFLTWVVLGPLSLKTRTVGLDVAALEDLDAVHELLEGTRITGEHDISLHDVNLYVELIERYPILMPAVLEDLTSASVMMVLCRFLPVLCPSVTQCLDHLEPNEDFKMLPREKLKFYETSCQWKMVSQYEGNAKHHVVVLGRPHPGGLLQEARMRFFTIVSSTIRSPPTTVNRARRARSRSVCPDHCPHSIRVKRSWEVTSTAWAIATHVETSAKYSSAVKYGQIGAGIESLLPTWILCPLFHGFSSLRNFSGYIAK